MKQLYDVIVSHTSFVLLAVEAESEREAESLALAAWNTNTLPTNTPIQCAGPYATALLSPRGDRYETHHN